MVKIGRIQTCQIFGSADSPRVRGGRSAVHGICSPEALQRSFQPQNYSGGRSAQRPRIVRGSSVHLVGFGYTGDMYTEQVADSPPWVHGQSASVRKNSPEAVPVGGLSKFSKADGPRLCKTGGVARLDLYGVLLSSPTTKPTTFNHKLSLFLSQARGGDFKVNGVWLDSRTVRALPRTLLDNLHHILSVFC